MGRGREGGGEGKEEEKESVRRREGGGEGKGEEKERGRRRKWGGEGKKDEKERWGMMVLNYFWFPGENVFALMFG